MFSDPSQIDDLPQGETTIRDEFIIVDVSHLFCRNYFFNHKHDSMTLCINTIVFYTE